MANLKVYPNGLTAGIPGKPPQTRGIKAEVRGWSRASVRSFLRFLYALDLCDVMADAGNSPPDALLVGFTLTVRDVPPTPDRWKRLRESFFRSAKRHHVQRLIWLTEWQGRGAPHLHGIAILPAELSPGDFCALWLSVASEFRPTAPNQHARPIYDATGWAEYLGKHSARGVHHYQRARRNIPAGWKGRTGRMWGRMGVWNIRDPVPVTCDRRTFYRLRRVLRAKAISEARAARRWRSLRFCRASLKCPDPVLSRIRGVSQFIDHSQVLAILEGLPDAWLTFGEQQ